jgi:hypothetical protein
VGPIIYVSFANERETQVKGGCCCKTKNVEVNKINNVPPNGSPCHVLNYDEMTVISPHWETWKKHSGDGHAYNDWTNGKSWSK